ncbi:MAG: serine/threonine-protein phosphatase [Rhizobiales bacterium]|nr:serine/threonine-protein phosphatase [Hyphomicrobiales bacterium]
MQDTLTLFETGAVTHPGKVRTRNEDSFLTKPDIGVWAVADGMGGHEGGDFASQLIVHSLNTIQRPNSPSELLRQCELRVMDANNRLLEVSEERGGVVIGSTVAVLLTYQAHYACVWSGDSRIYLIRGGEIVQISRDHTQVQQLVDEGVITAEEAKHWPGRNVITRAIGVSAEPELELIQGALAQGDIFVICSDGLTGHVGDAEILDYALRGQAQAACEALVELTLERGAHDNVTVVIARYQPRSSTFVQSLGGAPGRWG